MLRPARRSRVGLPGLSCQGRDVPGEPQPAGALPDLDQIVPFAVNLVEAIAQRSGRRPLKKRPAGAGQHETRFRIRQRQLRHDARHLRRLRAVGFQEFPARREVVEQIVDLDDGAFGRADLLDRRDGPAVDAKLGAALVSARARNP